MMKLSIRMCCSVIIRVVIHFLVVMLNMMTMTVMVMYIWMPMIHSDLLMANTIRWWVSMTHVRDYCIITRTTMRVGRMRLCRRTTSDRTTHRYVLRSTRMCHSSPWGSFSQNKISLKVTRTMKGWRRQLFIFVHFVSIQSQCMCVHFNYKWIKSHRKEEKIKDIKEWQFHHQDTPLFII